MCEEFIEDPLEDHHLPARVDQLLVHDRLVHPLSRGQSNGNGCEQNLRNCMF
jgi:hypothetical protein